MFLDKYWANVSVLLITDEPESYYHATYLINLFSKKLNDLNVCLRKVFLISKYDPDDIKRQFRLMIGAHNGLVQTQTLTATKDDQQQQPAAAEPIYEYLLTATTSKDNDHIIDELICSINSNHHAVALPSDRDEVSKDLDRRLFSLNILDKKLIFLKQQSDVSLFYLDLALVVAYLQTQMNSFVVNFREESDLNLYVDKIHAIGNSNSSVSVSVSSKRFKTNYTANALRVHIDRSSVLKAYHTLLSLDKSMSCLLDRIFCQNLFNDVIINADYFVYQFAKIPGYQRSKLESRRVLCDENNNNNSKKLLPLDELDAAFRNRTGLDFLLTKFDLAEFTGKILPESVRIIEEAFGKYNPRQMCISFNGGKDCCVVLYLYYAVALRLGIKFPLNVLLIKIDNQFDEMDHFIEETIRSFYGKSLNFIVIDEGASKSLKECLIELKELRPEINCILMGTRRTDGAYFKNMKAFEPTDGNWPSFMRINPVLDWTFSEIWYFIRYLELPYCPLYDCGYTSLDSRVNTVPNPALRIENNNDSKCTYMPAYRLENENDERNSRKK